MNWKKIVCPFLCLLLIAGCQQNEDLESHTSTHREIGTAQHELYYEDHYIVNITYPKTNIASLDERMKEDIAQLKLTYVDSLQDYQEERKAELNIDYQSYVHDDRYISVKLDVFQSIYDNKESIITYVYDKEREAFLTFDAIFDVGALEIVSNKVDMYFHTTFPNECDSTNFAIYSAPALSNYESFVLRKDKLVFYFQPNTLFDRSASIEIDYKDLQEYSDLQGEDVSVFVPYNDILNEPLKDIDPNKPMVALTFDDGPTPKYTNAILDTLKENNASATFFVLGNRASDFPEILQRMILEGNEIGNHTYSHKQLTALSKANIEDEITHTQETIHDVINRYPDVIRPPYGSKNDTVIQCAEGKKIVTWSLDTEDWRSRNAQTIVDKVINEVEDGSIILMHDLYASSAQAAIILIPKLQDMGYQLVTVSELNSYGKAPLGKIF